MIRLTYDEWLTVLEQCRACEHWDNSEGCEHPDATDSSPTDDCACFQRARDRDPRSAKGSGE